jgi:predicted ATPase/DNA-binding SARP family transcriptional activator
LADELIEYLWPGCENLRSAASNLRGRVAELRKILGPSFLLTRRGGYALSAESDCWIDAEEFSHLEELGRRAYRQENYDEAIRRLQEAVALYRGEYLAEDRYEEWALQRRERYRERFVEVLSLLADSLARRGQYGRALGYLERAIGEAPLQETLYRQLMVYAFCAGERARALGAYERCRAVLERELGERPSSQTEQLYRQIQSERVAELERVYPRAAPPSLPGGMRRPPFVGRAREWERLLLALERARAAPFFVMLSGEAGVGKTRLGEEFLRWAHTQGVQTLYGRCSELESPLPWQPWREALRGAQLSRADLVDIPPLWLAELAEVLPELRSLCEFSGMELPGEFRRYRLFEALAAVIGAVAARAPLIVMLDDLQWADSHSLDFLCYLLEKEVGVLLVGAARAEELGGKLDRVCHQAARRGRLEEIPLGRLSEQELQELLEKLADDLEVPRDFGGRLYRESMGNPLLATAVLQALFENGAFTPQGGRWSLREVRVERVPGAEVWLRRRVQRVSAAAQRVFQLLACAGQLELAVIEAAWEGTSEELLAHLGELISQGLVSERGGRYECAHDKFREVVYEQLEEPRRIWLHRRIAQAIEQVYSDPVAAGLAAQVAQHYERGGQPLIALEWIVRAVQDFHRHARYEEALQWATKGLELLQILVGRLPAHKYQELECLLMEHRVELLLRLGQLAEAEAAFGLLSERASSKARVHLLRADLYERLGKYPEKLAEAQAALELFRAAHDRAGEAQALLEHALALYYLGNLTEARLDFEQVLQISSDPEDRLGALENLALIARKKGDLSTAERLVEEALQLAAKHQLIDRESDLWYTRGAIGWQRGKYSDACEDFGRAAQICQTLGDRYGMAYALLNRAITLSSLGAYQQALTLVQQAEALFVELGNVPARATAKRVLGNLLGMLGEFELARSTLEEALQLCENDPRRQGECFVTLAELALAQQAQEEALSFAQRALDLALSYAHGPFPRGRIVLAEVLLVCGKYEDALRHSQLALNELHNWGGEFLIRAHYVKYRALKTLARPEAFEALRAAYDELLKTADQITDPSLRTSFLNIPLHRQILTELARA